jgi:hypothetical protein
MDEGGPPLSTFLWNQMTVFTCPCRLAWLDSARSASFVSYRFEVKSTYPKECYSNGQLKPTDEAAAAGKIKTS